MAVYKLTGSSVKNGRTEYSSFLAGNPAVDFGNYESIATVTLSGSQQTITFSSIPQTYKHLELRSIGRITSGSQYCTIRINNNTTASNYNYHALEGDGSTAYAFAGTSYFTPILQVNATANYFQPSIFSILDYTSTTKNKTLRGMLAQEYNGSGNITLISGAFYNTDAITQIDIIPNSSAFFATNSQLDRKSVV